MDEENHYHAIPDKYLPGLSPVLTCVQDDFAKGVSCGAKQEMAVQEQCSVAPQVVL